METESAGSWPVSRLSCAWLRATPNCLTKGGGVDPRWTVGDGPRWRVDKSVFSRGSGGNTDVDGRQWWTVDDEQASSGRKPVSGD